MRKKTYVFFQFYPVIFTHNLAPVIFRKIPIKFRNLPIKYYGYFQKTVFFKLFYVHFMLIHVRFFSNLATTLDMWMAFAAKFQGLLYTIRIWFVSIYANRNWTTISDDLQHEMGEKEQHKPYTEVSLCSLNWCHKCFQQQFLIFSVAYHRILGSKRRFLERQHVAWAGWVGGDHAIQSLVYFGFGKRSYTHPNRWKEWTSWRFGSTGGLLGGLAIGELSSSHLVLLVLLLFGLGNYASRCQKLK